jgi:hypothetical protein
MRIDGASIPFHIAKAYGIQPAGRIAPVAPVQAAAQAQRVPTGAERLIAAAVPGGISFDGPVPAPAAAALPFYRHPADKNTAATLISAGRTLDVTG